MMFPVKPHEKCYAQIKMLPANKVVDTPFPVIVMYYSWLHLWHHVPVGTSVCRVLEGSAPSSESCIRPLFLT